MGEAKTFKNLIMEFLAGGTEGISATGTLHIKGDQLIHYQTPIAERYRNQVIFNVTRYSLATGQLQKQIRELLSETEQIIVRRVPAGYTGSLADFIGE